MRATLYQLISGSAFNGTSVYFLKQDTLREFIPANAGHALYFANAAFDLAVIEKAAGVGPYGLIESGNVLDLLLLGKLAQIGEQGSAEGSFSLESLVRRYLNVDLPKDLKDDQGDDIRLSFGKFLLPDGSVNYPAMPSCYLGYAALDSIATYLLSKPLMAKARWISCQSGVDPRLLLSHLIQLKAAYALSIVSRNGLTLDPRAKLEAKEMIEGEIGKSLAALHGFGWSPGKGSATALQNILLQIESEHGIWLPRTDSGKLSSQGKVLQEYPEIPFFAQYMKYQNNRKLREFLNFDKEIVHARFNPIVSTGRTSSHDPNVQNFPRSSKIRSIITARPGYVLLDVDYSQIELCTLAQITFRRFGESKMMELLNADVDLHSYFAASLTRRAMSEIDKDGEDRRKAKACNFGFPGGLGVQSFIQYAKSTYEVTLSPEEAEALRNQWLDTFPEIRAYLEHDEMGLLINSGLLHRHLERFGGGVSAESLAWSFRGIVSGSTCTRTTGRTYTSQEVDWAFAVLRAAEFPNKSAFRLQIAGKRGSRDLWQNFMKVANRVTLPSGRVRANATYCQSKNNPFQGLAADGAKEALYELMRAGFRVVNFIHDEFLIEVPVRSDLRRVEALVKNILVTAMKRHCPDVQIKVDAKWMTHWSKKGDLLLNRQGELRKLDGSRLDVCPTIFA